MSPRNLLLSLLAFALVAAGLGLWFLGSDRGGGARVDQQPTAPVAPGGAELVGLDAPSGERASAVAPLATGGLSIDAGVRVRGSGRLTGRVLERESGAPLAGARVELYALPPAGARFMGKIAGLFDEAARYLGTGEPLAVGGTDASGAFRFEGVRRGEWYVQARGERHVPDTVARVHVTEAGDGGPAEVWVRRGGRVVGRVLKPDGSGAPGADVTLLPSITTILECARTGSLCWLEARTGQDGSFVIAGVPPGPGFDIYALGRGFALSFVLDVPVRAGEDAEVELRGRRGGRVAGRIVSGEGRVPLAGAHVAALPHGLRYAPFAPSLLAATHTETDAQGGYVLRNVPPGDLDVVAYAPGHVAALGPTVFVLEAGTAAAPDFVLAAGPTVRGRVVDGAGAPLPGVRVTWDPVGLDRFDFEGSFTAGSFAPVVARALKGVEFPLTDPDGRFEAGAFPGEPPYRFELSKEGYAVLQHEWTPAPTPEGEEPEELEIVMARGGWVEGIVMDAGEVAPLGSFSIRSDALLGGPGPPRIGPFGGGEVFEGEDGRFRLGPLAAGTAELEVEAPGFLTTVKEVEVAAGETKRGVIVELFPGGVVRGAVVDEDGAPVAGALVFARYEDEGASKRPENWEKRRGRGGRSREEAPKGLASYAAQLGLLAAGGTLSGADGRFELDGVEPGVQLIGAVHRDFASSWSEPVLVVHGEGPVETEIVMVRGGAIFGHVTDRYDRPIAGSIVIAFAPGSMESDEAKGDALYQGTTDAEGAYRIDHVAPGVYFMVLTRADEVLQPMSFLGSLSFDMVTVPEGEEVEYDLVDESVGGTRVFGRVIARDAEVGHGQVTAMSFEGDSLLGLDLKIARIREDASYEFEGLAPGEYQLQIEAAGLDGEARMQIDVPDVPEYQLDLVLPEGRIAGHVLDAATGEPVKNAWLSAESDQALQPEGLLSGFIGRESGRFHASAGEDGAFEFTGLEAATYRVSVRWAQGESVRYAPGEPVDVELRDDQRIDLELRLEPSLTVEGVVRNEAGELVADARISMWIEGRRDAMGRGYSGAEGRFQVDGLTPGTYVVSASHEDYAATRLEAVPVAREHADELALVLERGLAVRVRVLGADGRPVAGAAAQLRPAEGEADPGQIERMFSGLVEGDGVSDADGWLELGRFRPGDYVLEAQHGATRAEPREVSLERGAGEVRLEVRLR